VLQQASQSFVAANVLQRNAFWTCNYFLGRPFSSPALWLQQQLVILALMRTFSYVVTSIDSRDAIQMSYAEEYEVIQALVAQRANEPFNERLAVRRTAGSAHDLDPLFGQSLVKVAWKLPIPVVLDELHSEARFTGALHEIFGLSRHPNLVGMQRGGREFDPSSLDVEEDQDEGVAKTLCSQNSLTDEVGLPQTCRMSSDELVPRAATSRGTRIQPALLEDVADGARPNPQFPKFTHNPGQTPGGLHPMAISMTNRCGRLELRRVE
jgi:hypothetical protein